VHTSGSTYTPYKFGNITNGTHTIKAVVVDSDGQRAIHTVKITAGGGGTTSTGNKSPVVTILSPNNGQNFAPGTTVTVKLSSSDPDGSIAKHQVFVNNTLVDTDGATYTAHKINNVKAGTYAVKAKVTDNKGATAVTTISFTAGGATSKSVSSSLVASTKGDSTQVGGLTVENEEPASFTIAPNPVQEKSLHIYQNGHKYMRIVDMNGVILRKMAIKEKEFTVDLGEVNPGIYILIVDNESTKFIVE
jgi:hypothetical protein